MSAEIHQKWTCDLCHSIKVIESIKRPNNWVRISDHSTDFGGHDETVEYDLCDSCVAKIKEATK